MTADASHVVLLYSDFNCPFCYAMHERLHARGVMHLVQWRGVQHAPHLPVPMARWHGALGEELKQEVALVRRLAPDLSIALPPGKPNTKRAIETAAQALRQDQTRGAALVMKLYEAFWREGRDLSDQTVLDETVLAAGLDQPVRRDGATDGVAEQWDAGWRATGQSGVPLLVREDGMLLIGLASEADLDQFLAGKD
jgi:predicted DsbA family dithiol-disulfide isomerase